MLSVFFNPDGPQEQIFSQSFFDTVSSHVAPAVGPFLVAIGLAALFTAAAAALAPHVGMVKLPRGLRDLHVRPTPELGGPALFLAFGVAVLVFAAAAGAQVTGLLVVGGGAAAFFVLDDRFGLPAWVKLLAQLVLSLLALLLFGFVITYIGLPGGHILQLGLLGLPLTVFWLLGMQNTINFLDGVDGLAAGVVGIVALVLLTAAAGRGQSDVVLLSGALAGACAGFLFFNFHPARIFMGDSGSNFLGLAVGMLSILGVAKVSVAFALVVPALALAVPILDTAWAIVRRRRQRVSIAHADTRHIHHQLLDFGLSQPQTCLLFYSATAILGALGLMIFGHRRIWSVTIILLLVVLSTAMAEQLQKLAWRLPAPGLRGLLARSQVR